MPKGAVEKEGDMNISYDLLLVFPGIILKRRIESSAERGRGARSGKEITHLIKLKVTRLNDMFNAVYFPAGVKGGDHRE